MMSNWLDENQGATEIELKAPSVSTLTEQPSYVSLLSLNLRMQSLGGIIPTLPSKGTTCSKR